MVTRYQVLTECVEISDLLLKIAEENGWAGFPVAGRTRPCLVAYPLPRTGGWCNCQQVGGDTITIVDFIKLLRTAPPELPIKIDGYEVTFQPNGLFVGEGTFISAEKVEAIYQRFSEGKKT